MLQASQIFGRFVYPCWILGAVMACIGMGAIAAPPDRTGGILEQLGGLDSFAPEPGNEIRVSARVDVSPEGQATLRVTADLAPDWHIYSVTQQPGGPMRTRIVLEPSDDIDVAGPFLADSPPRVHELKEIYAVPLEEHDVQVTWSAPLQVRPGLDLSQLEIRGRLDGQVCRNGGQCIPLSSLDTTFVARVVSGDQQPPLPPDHGTANGVDASLLSSTPYRPSGANVQWQGAVEPQSVRPGDWVTVRFRALPDPAYHIYAEQRGDQDPKFNKPTVYGLREPWLATPMATEQPPVTKDIAGGEVQRYYETPVVWVARVQVPTTAPPDDLPLHGFLGFQTCTKQNCTPPSGVAWRVDLRVGEASSGSAPMVFSDADARSASEAVAATQWVTQEGDPARVQTSGDLGDAATAATVTAPILLSELMENVGFGLLGGLILNLMPCVLPVIGLKVLSFVEQAGQSRWRILSLNVVYSLGIISVFLVLATLVAFAGLNWGQQYNNPTFLITMAALVFAMALSFLGVWEIPIPGFSGASSRMAAREGLEGAFLKGGITTILSTPCSGPFLGLVLAYAFGKPPFVTYLIFASIGLGMSLPYLLIGIRPDLVRFLPRPGAWMETFKQFLGFVMLGAVVYLFASISDSQLMPPTLALLFAIWFACWVVGRIPSTATPDRRLRSWLIATTSAAVLGFVAFRVMGQHYQIVEGDNFAQDQPVVSVKDDHIVWRPYTEQTLRAAAAAGKTVMVEFTAKWCWTCQTNLLTAIETDAVRQVLQQNQVVPLLADWTDANDVEVRAALRRLNSISVPLLAIYPAGNLDRPIILRDAITKSQLVQNLRDAGPSSGPTSPVYAEAGGETRHHRPTRPATAQGVRNHVEY